MNISLIIPAAGLSTRRPPNKLKVRLGDKTVIEQTLDIYLSYDMEIILVTGYQSEEIMDSIPTRIRQHITVVRNTRYKQGLAESIKTGIRNASENCDYFGFGLGDKPFIRQETIRRLGKLLETRKPGILVPTFAGNPGHPTFFSVTYRDELLTLTGDLGGRELWKNHPADVIWFPVKDRGIIMDMDTYFDEK
ncbi:MAG: NTP transferase domain-containing protein [Fidelibacterota bacterium]